MSTAHQIERCKVDEAMRYPFAGAVAVRLADVDGMPDLRSVKAFTPEWMARQYVYVIGGETGPVKIGITNDLPNRLSALQTGSPRQLGILGAFIGGTAHERYLHKFYARERMQGEWFRVSKRMKPFLLTLMEMCP